VTAVFDGIPGQQFPLTLLEVSSEPDPASRTYEATFTMPAIEERVILPGMTVTVIVRAPQFEGSAGQVTLPAQAVMEDRDGRYVWVAEPGEEGLATIRRRALETGELTADGLLVLSGVSFGDQVVTAGMSRLVEGQVVRTGEGAAP
jgi:RND family efflux transporter MFP subunit